MTPIERALLARIERRAGELQPDLARRLLAAYRLIRQSLSDAEMTRLIQSGRADALIEALLNDKALDDAFSPLRRLIDQSVQDAGETFAKTLPSPLRGQVFDVIHEGVIEAARTSGYPGDSGPQGRRPGDCKAARDRRLRDRSASEGDRARDPRRGGPGPEPGGRGQKPDYPMPPKPSDEQWDLRALWLAEKRSAARVAFLTGLGRADVRRAVDACSDWLRDSGYLKAFREAKEMGFSDAGACLRAEQVAEYNTSGGEPGMNLSVLEDLELLEGGHDATSKKFCLMEAVAFVAGEPWSDHPACASRVLGDYGRSLNDSLPHALRQELKPLIPMLVGSVGDDTTEELRSVMLADWYIREHLPRVLTFANLEDEAQKLFVLPALTRENTQAAIDAVRAAGAAAWAARDARDAWDAWVAWDAWAAWAAWAAWDAWAARAAWAARDAWAAWAAWAAWDAWDAWAARAARAATFELAAQALSKQQGVALSGDTIHAVMEPLITEIARAQIEIFRRMIKAGPHGPTEEIAS